MSITPENTSFRIRTADTLRNFSDRVNNVLMVGGAGWGIFVNPIVGAAIFTGAFIDKEVITPVIDRAIRGRRDAPARIV